MWTIFKVFIKSVTMLFMFWLFGHEVCGIFAPESGIEPSPRAGRWSLNYWISREVPIPHFLKVFSCKQHFGSKACLNELSDPSWAALLTDSLLLFFVCGLGAVCGFFVPRLWIESGPSAVKVWSPNHLTAREFPPLQFYIFLGVNITHIYWSPVVYPSMYCAEDIVVTKMWTLWSKMEFVFWKF